MDEARASALVAEIEAAWNTHDMRRFAACFAEDADFVNVAGVWWRGRGEIEERHAASHAGRFKHSRMGMRLAGYREIGPGMAVAHVRWTLNGHEASGPRRTTETREGLMTWLLRTLDRGIEIAASHNTDVLNLHPREES